jgi:hypothetical protein
MVITSVVTEFTSTDGMTYSFFGLAVHGGLQNPLVLYILGIFVLHSVAAYGLLWSRSCDAEGHGLVVSWIPPAIYNGFSQTIQ